MDVLASASVSALALAVRTVSGSTKRVVAKRQEGRHVVVGDEHDIAAVAAVAAVWASTFDVRLAPERDAAGAAITTFDVNVAFVDEAGHFALESTGIGARRGHR